MVESEPGAAVRRFFLVSACCRDGSDGEGALPGERSLAVTVEEGAECNVHFCSCSSRFLLPSLLLPQGLRLRRNEFRKINLPNSLFRGRLKPTPLFFETGSTNDAGEEGSQEKLEKAGLASLD